MYHSCSEDASRRTSELSPWAPRRGMSAYGRKQAPPALQSKGMTTHSVSASRCYANLKISQPGHSVTKSNSSRNIATMSPETTTRWVSASVPAAHMQVVSAWPRPDIPDPEGGDTLAR